MPSRLAKMGSTLITSVSAAASIPTNTPLKSPITAGDNTVPEKRQSIKSATVQNTEPVTTAVS
ncbi:hypothetical protein D3C81_2092400 [compost metagenome]